MGDGLPGISGRLITVEVDSDDTGLVIGRTTPLFRHKISNEHTFDVSADGEMFLAIRPVEQRDSGALTLVTNWPATLRGR